MRRMSLVFLGLGLVIAGQPATGSPSADPDTTLGGSIIAEGERDLGYGPGLKRVARTLDWRKVKGKGVPLAGFKQLTDIHVVDEESPGRVEYLDNCQQSSAYRPQEALSAHVAESMLRRTTSIKKGPATGVPLDFTVTTGDNVDNNQYNETRWFIDMLDGEDVIPDSGALGSYDGYTREHTATALSDDVLQLAQDGFEATGAKQPWYVVLGNHDGLVQGNLRENIEFQFVTTGGKKAFVNIDDYDGCPEDPNDFEALLAAFQDAYLNHSESVPADNKRRFLKKEFLHEEFFKTTGKPVGHGLKNAPDYPYLDQGQGSFPAGYYAFQIAKRVIGVSLDSVAFDLSSNGQLDNEQFEWLERTLKKNSRKYYDEEGKRRKRKGKNNLVVLFSHHSSTTMTTGTLPEGAPEEMAPLHCFEPDDNEGCDQSEGLRSLIHRFPNVIAWVNGHEHNNRVRPFGFPGDPKRAFWEINTASHIDWPQQSRLLEIAYVDGKNGKADTVIIYGTLIDHMAGPDVDQSTQDPIEYLASLSRIEAYHDACVREDQADCSAPGDPGDQNVKLTMKAPFNL